VLQRQVQNLRKSPTLAKTARMGHPTSKANFNFKANFEDLEKKNGINNFCLSRLLR
jgi:hypothetical protein